MKQYADHNAEHGTYFSHAASTAGKNDTFRTKFMIHKNLKRNFGVKGGRSSSASTGKCCN